MMKPRIYFDKRTGKWDVKFWHPKDCKNPRISLEAILFCGRKNREIK